MCERSNSENAWDIECLQEEIMDLKQSIEELKTSKGMTTEQKEKVNDNNKKCHKRIDEQEQIIKDIWKAVKIQSGIIEDQQKIIEDTRTRTKSIIEDQQTMINILSKKVEDIIRLLV
jgi:chromosome segregation ATPase